ncbi:MAG: hypothetical protein ACTSUO_05610 [Candidatus Thorarchaeota archaeon]
MESTFSSIPISIPIADANFRPGVMSMARGFPTLSLNASRYRFAKVS